MATFRRHVKRVLVATRLDDPLLRARRSLAPAGVRRNYRDMANLRLYLRLTLQPTDCCIDVGANRGQLLEEFVRLSPGGRHLAFEPVPVLAEFKRKVDASWIRTEMEPAKNFHANFENGLLGGLAKTGLGLVLGPGDSIKPFHADYEGMRKVTTVHGQQGYPAKSDLVYDGSLRTQLRQLRASLARG